MLKQNVLDAKNSLKRYPFPQDVVVETTAYCNLRCVMCPQKDLTRPRGYMDTKVFRMIVEEVARESPQSRLWVAIMGEPLLHPKIAIMVEYATYLGLRVCLNTNAMLLDAKIGQDLVSAGVAEVLVGLDAATKETYERIRVGGDFDRVVYNTLRFKEMAGDKLRVLCQFIEMEQNCTETDAFREFWLSKGMEVKIRPRLGWGLGVKAENLVVPANERFPCPWLIRTVSIHWDGTIAQCDGDYDEKYTVGKIQDMTIAEAWEGELAKRRERHWQGDFTYPSCVNCKDWQAGRSYYYAPQC